MVHEFWDTLYVFVNCVEILEDPSKELRLKYNPRYYLLSVPGTYM